MKTGFLVVRNIPMDGQAVQKIFFIDVTLFISMSCNFFHVIIVVFFYQLRGVFMARNDVVYVFLRIATTTYVWGRSVS